MPAMAIYNFKRRIKCHRRYETTIDLPFHRRWSTFFWICFCYCLSYGSRRRCNSQRNFSVYLLLWWWSISSEELMIAKYLCVDLPAPQGLQSSSHAWYPTGLQNGIFILQTCLCRLVSTLLMQWFPEMQLPQMLTLIYNVMFSFYTACASFIGQNWGAGNKNECWNLIESALHMPSFSVQSWVDYSLCLATVSFSVRYGTNSYWCWYAEDSYYGIQLCIQLFMDGSIAASRGIGKVFRLPLSLSWAPAYFVLSGFIQYLHISRHFICIFVYLLMGNYRTCRNSVFVVSFNI